MPRQPILIEEATTSATLHALAKHCGTEPGQMEMRVRAGGRAGNPTFEALRIQVGDGEAPIFSIPSIGRATHWAALSGARCAVVKNHAP